MAFVLTAVFASGAAGQSATTETDRPDAGASLIQAPGENRPVAEPANGAPPPRSLDSVRAPVPDRLALPAWIQDAPLAPPTPWVQTTAPSPSALPPFDGTTGGGAKRVKAIIERNPGPTDIPRDSVTRTPEDQNAPPPEPTSK